MMETNTSGYMPSVSIGIEGDKEAVKYLNMLATKFQRRILVRVARKAVKPLIQRAKSLAPRSGRKTYITAHRDYSRRTRSFSTRLVKRRSGELARSIGVYLPKNRQVAAVYVGPRTKNVQQANNGWYGHFLELGTKGYVVKKNRTVVSPSGGIFVLKKGTRVPGQKPQPFMGPAWESTKTEVLKNFENYLWDELEKV